MLKEELNNKWHDRKQNISYEMN